MEGAGGPFLQKNMYKTSFSFIMLICILLTTEDISFAQQFNQGRVECRPVYGHHPFGPRWGWYGARRIVKTPAEAREIIEKTFIAGNGIKIGIIRERHHFFEAEIVNMKGSCVDLIIIDRRTGRIRTIY